MAFSELTTKVFPRLAGLVGIDPASISQQELVKRAFDIALPPIVKAAADSMAADATSSTKAWANPFPFDLWIERAIISPGSTLTAHAANNASIILSTDDAADGSPAEAVRWTTSVTGTGNWATDVVLTPTTYTAAGQLLRSGANLFWSITKASSGVVVPAMQIVVVARRL